MKFSTQPQKLTQLIGNTYRFFPQLGPQLIFILIGMVATNFLLMVPIFIAGATFFAMGVNIIAGVALALVAYLIIGLLNAFWAGAVTTRSQGAMSEDNAMIETTWSNAKNKLLRVFLLGICIVVLSVVIALIAVGLLLLVAKLLGSWGTIILAVPVMIFVIFLYIRLMSFSLPTVVLEGTGIISAFSRSSALSKGMVWKIIATIICAAFPGWVLLMVQSGLTNFMAASYTLIIINVILQLLATFINSVLGMSAALVLFNDARVRQASNAQ